MLFFDLWYHKRAKEEEIPTERRTNERKRSGKESGTEPGKRKGLLRGRVFYLQKTREQGGGQDLPAAQRDLHLRGLHAQDDGHGLAVRLPGDVRQSGDDEAAQQPAGLSGRAVFELKRSGAAGRRNPH